MYSSQLFDEENMIDWEEKADTDKIWPTWKYYFREIHEA